ncbi:hypothetical protein BH11PSE7_BH11PSE7_27900 [soil metagenome]
MNKRQIAITVDEVDPGCFAWMLLESSDELDTQEVATANSPSRTYGDAWNEGYAALRNRVHADPSLVPSPMVRYKSLMYTPRTAARAPASVAA